MWIMTNKSFVSIVQHFDKPDTLVVRGRFAGDVATFLQLSAKREKVTPDNDYRYRIEADRPTVEEAMRRVTAAIDYPNFKNSCPAWRHEVYMRVWSVMHRAQHLALTGGKWWDRLFAGAY
jgi:hypothetical protein